MKTYTQKELDQICATFTGWLYDYSDRFLYATLKEVENRENIPQDYICSQTPCQEWYKKFGKGFQKILSKYDPKKIKKARVEIGHYLAFVALEFVENYFSNKEQKKYFVDKIKRKTVESDKEIGVRPNSDIFLKYINAENHIQRFSHDMEVILGKRSAILQFRITAQFYSFFKHTLPIFVKAIFEGDLRYIDTRQ